MIFVFLPPRALFKTTTPWKSEEKEQLTRFCCKACQLLLQPHRLIGPNGGGNREMATGTVGNGWMLPEIPGVNTS